MHTPFLSAKLLIVLVASGCGKNVVEASKLGGAQGGTKLRGYGSSMAGNADFSYMACMDQDIVFIVMRDEAENVVDEVAKGAWQRETGYTGSAILIDVPKALLRSGRAGAALSESEGEVVDSGITMISSIINCGQAEALMAAAREAGATGGTILNARGTGTEDDVKFFGISLAPEKELLVIISEDTYTNAILDALSAQPIFSEPGGGIIFTTKVEKFISLGR